MIFKEKNKQSKEEQVAIKISLVIAKELKAEAKVIVDKGNSYIYISNKKFDLLINTCLTNKKRVVKIEEILVGEAYRGKGICTKIINIIEDICKKEDVTVGLWCRKDNKRNFNYYSRLGFKYIETVNDDWLEFN